MFWEVYALDRQEYLKSLTEQIRTKRARTMVAEEVEAHIEDQKQDFMAHGLGEEEAESMAVVEMGDPVEAGVKLDRVHRPKMEWTVLMAILIISIMGLILQAVVTSSFPTMDMSTLEAFKDNFLYGGIWSAMLIGISKSLSLAGERIGYLTIPTEFEDSENVIKAVRLAMGRLGFVNAPALFQRIVGECIDEQVDLEYYAKNREILYGTLKQCGYECIEPKGAFYIFVKAPDNNEERFLELARKRHLIFVGGSSFGYSGYVRLSFCCKYEVLQRAADALKQLADDCKINSISTIYEYR